MGININGMRILCDTCGVIFTRPTPNKIKTWRDTGRAPSFSQALTTIRHMVGMLDPFGFSDQGYYLHGAVYDLKVYALFRLKHKDHRLRILRPGQPWPAGTEDYIPEYPPSEDKVKNSWNKLGDWTGGQT